MTAPTLQTTTVTTENCVLHITYTGTGSKLLVLIPGGAGLGSSFHAALPGLAAPSSGSTSDEYTVATFDRRGHGASSLTSDGAKINTIFSPVQASRDVAAIITHLKFARAAVFGTSMGGVIALHFGVYFPDKLDKLVAHESPTFGLLPGLEGAKWLDHITSTYDVYKALGPLPAIKVFFQMTRGWDATSRDDPPEGEVLEPLKPAEASDAIVATTTPSTGAPPPLLPETANVDLSALLSPDQLWWLEHEFLTGISTPNLWELRAHLYGDKYTHLSKDSFACATGRASRDAPYVATARVQAEITGVQLHSWPGGHLVYVFDAPAFVVALRDSLGRLK